MKLLLVFEAMESFASQALDKTLRGNRVCFLFCYGLLPSSEPEENFDCLCCNFGHSCSAVYVGPGVK